MSPFRRSAALVASLILASSVFAGPEVQIQDPRPFPPLTASDTLLPGDCLPRLVKQVEVVYPESLMADGGEDRVFVAFVVNSKGEVRKVRPIFGGHPEAEAAVVAAVEKWQFEPGRHEGRLVSTQMTVEVRFVPSKAGGG